MSRAWRRAGVLSVLFLLLGSMVMPALATAGPSPLFGSSVERERGETFQQALARRDAAFGPLAVLRVFNPSLPRPWSEMPAAQTGRPLAISFKVTPTAIVSGSHDEFFRHWFASAPRDREIWWTYWHEPENDIRDGTFTAPDYRAAFRHLDRLADEASNPRLHTTQILMDWTLAPASGRDWRTYYPGGDVIDVQAWDMYDFVKRDGTYRSMAEHQARRPSYAVTMAEGNGFGIAEIGSTEPQGRPDWLRDVGLWARDHRARFVTYFDSRIGGDFRLTDTASQQAWDAVVDGTLFHGPPQLTTGPATNVTRTSATFHCDVDPNELQTQVWFTSWKTSGGSFEQSPATHANGGPEHIESTRTGLEPGTQYAFRCKATNAAGATKAAIGKVTTLP